MRYRTQYREKAHRSVTCRSAADFCWLTRTRSSRPRNIIQIIVRYKLSAVSKPLLVAQHYAAQRCRTSPSRSCSHFLRAGRVKSHRRNRIIKALRCYFRALVIFSRKARLARQLARGLENLRKLPTVIEQRLKTTIRPAVSFDTELLM